MKKILLFILLFFISTNTWAELPIAPRWFGEIELAPGVIINIRFNFKEESPGKYSVTVDSPEQGVEGMRGVVNHISPKGFEVAVPKISLKYKATIVDTEDGKVANGIFNQITVTTAMIMTPGDDKPLRPQTPQPPFPYTIRDVSFKNPEDGTLLKGTLTLPVNYYEGTPAVVLVSDSGLQNRDGEIFDHRPFAVIADYLARIGIATLRYDDRGFGESEGEVESATTEDLAFDAKGALKYLKETEGFRKAGILGHGEGATIAFILGNSDYKPDFIIGLAQPAAKGEGNYDSSLDMAVTRCPVLALYGEKDMEINVTRNVDAFKNLQPDAELIVFPGLNHLFQHAKTGSKEEYSKIEETISPEVLSEIGRFIQKNR